MNEEQQPRQRELEELLLKFVLRDQYQPVKPRIIARKLGLPKDEHADLKKALKRLVKQGKLSYGSKHLVRGPGGNSQNADRRQRRGVSGVFRRASAGYGFVRPQGAPPDRSQDIYISSSKTRDAADGDVVAVQLAGKRRRGERVLWAGEIVEVLERQTHQFVGVYFERGAFGFVQVDGTNFAQPVQVGDPGAKSATPGDKVVIEMVRFPSHTHDGEAVIVEVLGARGEPGVDTLSIMREFDLPTEFPEDVLEDARQRADRFDETNLEDRLDLTNVTVITIDPVDARDFDDAISLAREDNGHWQLGVHIADVAHFVKPKSALDREARERATSVYLPDRVIPMLPETISNHLASLQPDQVRFTKTVVIEFTPDGARVGMQPHNAAIRSKRRFAYEEVDQFIEQPEAWREKVDPPVFELLQNMYELAMLLRRRRLDGGSIELSLPEIKVDLDKKGRVEGAHLVKNTESHQIIEEFMLAANEAVADCLHEKELNFLRRIHESPDPRKLKNLSRFVRELGIECESLESRFEIKRVVQAVAGRPEEHAVNFAVLRSMQKARYGPEEEGHYALNSRNYGHFTSPIRRYPDLTIHRMLEKLVAGKRPVDDFDQQTVLGEHCSQREQRAEQAERELTKLKLLNFLSQQIGQKMDAVITGVERYGLFTQGTGLPAEGFVSIDSLQDDYYEFDTQAHCLTGRRAGNSFRLGDLVEVEIARVDVNRRELDFRLVAPKKSSSKHQATKSGQTTSHEKKGRKAAPGATRRKKRK
jgi:ribonuclease R